MLRRRLDSGRSSPYLVPLFVLTSLLGLVAAGAAILFVVERELTAEAERHAIERARITTSALLSRRLAPSDLGGGLSQVRRAQLERLLAQAKSGLPASEITLYDASRTAIASTVGSRVPTSPPPEVGAAIAGRTVSHVTARDTLKTFVPVHIRRSTGVIEFDTNFRSVTSANRRTALVVAAILEVLLAALYLVLVPPLRRAASRARIHVDEIEQLTTRRRELRTAVDTEQLRVYYQPQADVATGTISAAEALVRWQHPHDGLLAPAQFVDDAERAGLITDLTRVVLRTAIRQWRTWADDGIQIDLALNLTAADLELPTVADEITETLQDHGMPADRLVLEITERTTLRERREVQRSLQRLTDLAVCLSIDDYGIGFSSLDALRRLPVRQLKIDRRFIHGIPDDTKNLEIVRSTIELAHNLGATVVAEGVETRSELAELMICGCDLAQGFLIAPPLPAEHLTEILSRQAAPFALA